MRLVEELYILVAAIAATINDTILIKNVKRSISVPVVVVAWC